ncbi:MAG: transglutaminase family protein [Verrucomicrobiales bacterium]|nr:transglutaminase family protein [Verrucomicrobiota bacterium JB025]
MTPAGPGAPPPPAELDALLRLLDDETPEVRETIGARLASYGGDLSESITDSSVSLSDNEHRVLSDLLLPSRRATLEQEWQAPSGGAAALREDWDRFEALLRAISDYLHDGVTIRQPLSDALDLLAEEATQDGVTNSMELRSFLFEQDRLSGNNDDLLDPRNSDLAWSIAEGKSNPLGLGIIFILVGRRLGLEIEPVNFPGHFLTRIFQDGYPIIIDCYDHGQVHLQSSLLESPDLTREFKKVLKQAAHPGIMLVRLLNNLENTFLERNRPLDLKLVRKLRESLT